MSYTVRLLANAQRDLSDIEAYYNEHVPHETERCLNVIEHALEWIELHAHQPLAGRYGLRCVSTDTFRYSDWYRLFEVEQFVQVVAILHHRRGNDALTARVP